MPRALLTSPTAQRNLVLCALLSAAALCGALLLVHGTGLGSGMDMATAVARVGGGLLIATGLYQLSPLKNLCLSKCRSPLGFVLTSWRDGPTGAVRMGLLHGGYCLGCCWLLFAILFPLGIMNIAAMALITVVVVAEKALASKPAAVYGAAVPVAYGAVVIAAPRTLPAFTAPGPPVGLPAATGSGAPARSAPMPMHMSAPGPPPPPHPARR